MLRLKLLHEFDVLAISLICGDSLILQLLPGAMFSLSLISRSVEHLSVKPVNTNSKVECARLLNLFTFGNLGQSV